MIPNILTVQLCPFCGGENAATFERDAQLWSVSCPNCGAIGPEAIAEVEAITLWNIGKHLVQNDNSSTNLTVKGN